MGDGVGGFNQRKMDQRWRGTGQMVCVRRYSPFPSHNLHIPLVTLC